MRASSHEPLGFISWTGTIPCHASPSPSLRDRTGAAGPYEAALPILRMTRRFLVLAFFDGAEECGYGEAEPAIELAVAVG